ncbi:MAG TPA: signal recognition particle-docking protein FtsY [Gemmatimonadaceae bacterium]|nr:signal recognition particle-docking protein FtsY [Gemmatimonadaceae bacterium]
MARLTAKRGDPPGRTLWERIRDIALADVGVLARGGVAPGSLEQLEEILLEADFGVPTTLRLVGEIERLAQRGVIRSENDFRAALEREVEQALRAGTSDAALTRAGEPPTVVLVIGVNGAGKTTLIAKLAALLAAQGERVLVGAADTFRAGAIDQLREWSKRAGAEFVGSRPGADPAAVAFDAVDAGISRGADIVLVDTAGRLHTSDALMEELRKIHRVIARRLPGAPHETLLVLDGTIGQNALQQGRMFAAAVPVTGLVVTKLDGTARGGIVVAVHEALDVPVKFTGTGERMQDIEPFDASRFAAAALAG